MAPVAFKWLTSARSALHDAEAAPTLRGVRIGRTAARTNLDDLLRTAPHTLTPEEAQVAQRLRAIAAFDDAVRAAALSVDQNWRDINPSLRTLAADAAPNADTEVTDWLTAKARALVHDAACDLAWRILTEPEQSQVHMLIDNQSYQPIRAATTIDLGAMAQQAALGAIQGNAKSAFLKLFVRAEYVDWFNYAKELYDKANQLTADGDQTIVHPNGAVTRAYIYYARSCLVPPK